MADLMNTPIIEEATKHTPPDQLMVEQCEAYAWERAECLKAQHVELEVEQW